jgi:nucleoside phosphorylase
MPATPTFPKDEYTVGWICALDCEMAAAKAMLDEVHGDPEEIDTADQNHYTLGQIADHKVVIAGLPAGIYGTNAAATMAKDMSRTFKSIGIGLMVGIGGGAPSDTHDIRVGDIVVSLPSATGGGVIQHDLGKTVIGSKFQRTGMLNSPPKALLTALKRMKTEHELRDGKIPQYLNDMLDQDSKMVKRGYTYQGAANDRLYQATYNHLSASATCKHCDPSYEVDRNPRDGTDPIIHYGNIASGNQVIKDGITRNRLWEELGVLCFEMEAAGLMSDFPCLVIRGICDYYDSHKNERWQNYATSTAAAFAKESLSFTLAPEVRREKPVAITQVSGEQSYFGFSKHNFDFHDNSFSNKCLSHMYTYLPRVLLYSLRLAHWTQ